MIMYPNFKFIHDWKIDDCSKLMNDFLIKEAEKKAHKESVEIAKIILKLDDKEFEDLFLKNENFGKLKSLRKIMTIGK